MTEIKIDNIPNIENITFNFESPLVFQANKPFPDELFGQNGSIPITSFAVSASEKFTFAKGTNSVEFGLGADAFSAFGVYRQTDSLFETLQAEGLSEPMANLLHLQIFDDENLLALRWGYGLKAAVDGKVALAANPINITFGVDAEKNGLFTLLHKRNRDENVLEAITETLKSWTVPRQIKSSDDLNPKTTIVMETLGEISTSIGVQYGFEYSWLRNDLSIGDLSGDLGVRINAAVDAQFGFSALGRYAVALSRENADEKIRLQVFKLKQKGMTFAFNGGISGQINKHPFPKNADDFIKGVFNLNGSQVLKDFEKWLDPNAKIEDLLGDELVEQAKKLVKTVTGVDPDTELEKATDKFKELIEIWQGIPDRVSSLIYDLLPTDLTELRDFLNQVREFSGTDAEVSEKIRNEIEKHLEDVEFYKSPVGKWLMEIANGELTALLANFEKERKDFLDIAGKTSRLLDGSEVEKRIRNLQRYVEKTLHLNKIKDLSETDEWLKQRLKKFLGKQTLVNKDLEQIRDVINKFRKKSDEFYKKAYQALAKKYGAEINYQFQRTVSSDALIDLTFDFSAGTKTSSKKYLKLALDGDFNEILSTKIPGITLNKAVLSHGIKRNSHLSITLPYQETNIKHINESIAKGEIIDEADGRLWVFNLGAEDILKKDDNLSKLAISSQWTLELKDDANIRRFGEENHKISHSSLSAENKTRRKQLEFRYELAADEYFRADINSFAEYLTNLDKTLDGVDIKGDNNFGSVLTSLSLGLDGRVLSVWKKIPEDFEADFYREMSLAVQRRFQDWIPKAYIQDPLKYDDEEDIYALLVYMSLPSFSEFVKPRHKENIGTNVYHWEYFDVETKMKTFEDHCRFELINKILPQTRNIIKDLPIEVGKKEKILAKYENSKIEDIKKVMKKQKAGGLLNHLPSSFNRLCKLEREIIERIVETAQKFHGFLDNKNDFEKGIKALAEFGAKFTDTFNDELGHISFTPKGALRPLGLVLMSDIAKILEPKMDKINLSAIFDIYVLKPEITKEEFKVIAEKFLDGELPENPGQVALQQRIINKDTPLIF